jgi:chromatin segregation and condensation protein Rec8/ScpA/Scc1 (kleisin family)
LTDDEEKSIRDLETRLKIYKRIKDAEKNVLKLFGQKISYFGGGNYEVKKYFLPDQKTNKNGLLSAIKSVIKSLPKVEIRPQVVIKNIMSLENMIDKLTQRISSNLNLSFKEFSGYGKEHKVNVVISFLAVLELVKQGVIEVIQNSDSDDIEIQTKKFNTPNYI